MRIALVLCCFALVCKSIKEVRTPLVLRWGFGTPIVEELYKKHMLTAKKTAGLEPRLQLGTNFYRHVCPHQIPRDNALPTIVLDSLNYEADLGFNKLVGENAVFDYLRDASTDLDWREESDIVTAQLMQALGLWTAKFNGAGLQFSGYRDIFDKYLAELRVMDYAKDTLLKMDANDPGWIDKIAPADYWNGAEAEQLIEQAKQMAIAIANEVRFVDEALRKSYIPHETLVYMRKEMRINARRRGVEHNGANPTLLKAIREASFYRPSYNRPTLDRANGDLDDLYPEYVSLAAHDGGQSQRPKYLIDPLVGIQLAHRIFEYLRFPIPAANQSCLAAHIRKICDVMGETNCTYGPEDRVVRAFFNQYSAVRLAYHMFLKGTGVKGNDVEYFFYTYGMSECQPVNSGMADSPMFPLSRALRVNGILSLSKSFAKFFVPPSMKGTMMLQWENAACDAFDDNR
ncbi:unnamed protein product, partial [Mesorhabditis spiculigera]